MIKLLNGRGQLGEAISSKLKALSRDEDIFIYHTWNVEDKSEVIQRQELEKFVQFIDANMNERIIFTSTYSQQEDWYVHYKQLSEAYLLNNCKNGLVLRFPTLIGKGILPKLKNQQLTPHGTMELMSIDMAADHVIKKISYNGLVRSFYFAGEKILAKTAHQLLTL